MQFRELENILKDALKRLGVEIRCEPVENSSGGFARLGDDPVVVYSPDLPEWTRIDLFLKALRRLDTSGIYLPPAVRDRLEETEGSEF